MTVYMVERNLKSIAMSDLAAAQKGGYWHRQFLCRQGHAHPLYPLHIRPRGRPLHVPV